MWNEKKPKTSIMQRAREIRYKKIINFCKQNNIMTVMTAHHLDDSLETYYMKKKEMQTLQIYQEFHLKIPRIKFRF